MVPYYLQNFIKEKRVTKICVPYLFPLFIGVLHHENGPEDQCDIAIKIPILSLNDRGRLEGELRDFYTEAKLTSDFSHKNILSCLGITNGMLFYLYFKFVFTIMATHKQ